MTKRVVTSDQVYHLWAHGAQDSARNGTGSVFFEGDTVYSYRTDWPLARIFKRGSETLVLTNSGSYSVTTTRHQHCANLAASHLPQVAVPDVNADGAAEHTANLAALHAEISALLTKSQRVMSAGAVTWRRDEARRVYDGIKLYRTFFKVPGRVPAFPEAAFAAALDRATRIETPDPVRDAKRFKARQRREAADAARLEALRARFARENAEKADAWRAGQRVYFNEGVYQLPRRDRRALGGISVPCMLRVAAGGAEIETSQGARIPLDHAPRIWRLICSVRAAGREYVRNGHTEHAGTFAIDRVDADGTLHAGCHVIAYAELERMARTLNLIGG